MYTLLGSSEHPVEYYSGGTHMSDGERVPNTVCSVDYAKKYDSVTKAQKQAERLNNKYSWFQTFYAYEIGDQKPAPHGTITIQ